MRQWWRRTAGIAAVAGVLLIGCSGDFAHRVATDEKLQAEVMDAIGGNPELAGKMVDRLLAGDTQSLVMDRVLGNSSAVQGLMTKVARDQTVLDGVLNLAVQDSTMRAHILTLFKGMQMMGN